jgi:hypothetical protein
MAIAYTAIRENRKSWYPEKAHAAAAKTAKRAANPASFNLEKDR